MRTRQDTTGQDNKRRVKKKREDKEKGKGWTRRQKAKRKTTTQENPTRQENMRDIVRQRHR